MRHTAKWVNSDLPAETESVQDFTHKPQLVDKDMFLKSRSCKWASWR